MKGYQLKITIKGSKPPIWRRVVVPEQEFLLSISSNHLLMDSSLLFQFFNLVPVTGRQFIILLAHCLL